jgi:hypothetical protein
MTCRDTGDSFRHVLSNGWQALGIFSAQTGFPFTITEPYGTLQYGYDSLNGAGARPNLILAPTKLAHGVPQSICQAM